MNRLVPALFLLAALTAAAMAPSLEAGPMVAELSIKEPGFQAKLRLRVYHDPEFLSLPESAGHLFLVQADSAAGTDAFFIPTDLALEVGDRQVYRAEFEQTGDLFGQALGGKLREGETHLGFLLAPSLLAVGEVLPAHPDSLVLRYANHRAAFRPATQEETRAWESVFDRPQLSAALNVWWEWAAEVDRSPPLEEGEARFLAERLFQGQGHVLEEEGVSMRALRNAILRVGERRMLQGPATQRVAPRYPAAARQAGVSGLVIALCYVSETGEVGDALVLASNTAHLLNLSALSSAVQWRFRRVKNEAGEYVDGWRLLPFHFKLPKESVPPDSISANRFVPPRVVKTVPVVYPEKARQRRIEGTVIYTLLVSERGKLLEAKLEQSAHPLLDEAALEALEQYLFVPGMLDGREIAAEISIPLTFGKETR